MSQAPKRITLDEAAARRMLLAQAIETSDAQGKLLSPVEREEIDRLALQFASRQSSANPVSDANVQAFLNERARQVLGVVENRNPALASLQERRPWTRWLAVAAFLAAALLGAATDRIANPHRVDLLSLPLLAIVGWNLAVYCALIASYFLQRRKQQQPHQERPASFMRWADGWRGWHRRAGQLRATVTAVFTRQWYGATAALQTQRWRKVLHLAAAGWAFGIGLSLFARGLVVEYRVGWESTFLNADQVHAALRVLLMPAMALFPFEPFSVQDIASLQFSNGSGAMAGARWVYIYATLLAVVVIVPRLALALYARWRERVLSRRVVLSLSDAYYQRLLGMLNPTRVQLGLLALRDEDRHALLRVMQPRNQTFSAAESAPGEWQPLMRTSTGEALWIAHIPAASQPQQPPQPLNTSPSWAGRAFGRLMKPRPADAARAVHSPQQAAHDDSDVMLIVVQGASDLEAVQPARSEAPKPTLLLVNSPATADTGREVAVALCRAKARTLGLHAEVLGFEQFAHSWVQAPVLLDALARCMPSHKKAAFARLTEAWLQRNQALFAESMQVIATQLLDAAREVEEARSALPYVKRLISTTDRQADALARKAAMATVVERLQRSVRQSHARLLRLHGIDDAQGMLLEQPLKEKFDVQAPINAKEAGLAGAATGAASGASIDLVTGGLTLGAAAALGALIGGGAAYAGAAWKNRATPAGTTLVQLSDEMLQTMLAAALLRYLAIADVERSARLPMPSRATQPFCGKAGLWPPLRPGRTAWRDFGPRRGRSRGRGKLRKRLATNCKKSCGWCWMGCIQPARAKGRFDFTRHLGIERRREPSFR